MGVMHESPDERGVHRIVVDVLATEAQVAALQTVIGEALCAAPADHDGPCRIAWQTAFTTWTGSQDAGYGLDAAAAQGVRDDLEPVEVWPRADVDRSLGLT